MIKPKSVARVHTYNSIKTKEGKNTFIKYILNRLLKK